MIPAWFDFHKDRVMQHHPAACTVYASLLSLENILFEARPIKAWVLAEALGMEKETVLKALNLLVDRGYVVEHGRSANNVRVFSVAAIRKLKAITPAA